MEMFECPLEMGVTIREHLPVARGGLTVIGLMFGLLFMVPLAVILLAAGPAHHISGEYVWFVIVGTALFSSSFARVMIGGFGHWFRAYWRQNVKGYVLEVVGTDDKPLYSVQPWHDFFVHNSALTYLVLPLGGWFRRPFIMLGSDLNEGQNLVSSEWQIKRWRLCPNDAYVLLVDKYGASVELPPSEVLRLLDYAFQNKFSDLQAMLVHAMAEIPRLTKELKEVRVEVSELEHKLFESLRLISNTIDALDKSKRFIKSKEARKIREDLAAEYLQLLPANDERRKKFAVA